jgi:hypothetical protein
MIENTIIKDTLDRAFSGLELMLGCKTTTKTKRKSKAKKKCCGKGNKCKSKKCKTSGFVSNLKKETK